MKKLYIILCMLLLPVLGYSADWYVSSAAGGGGDGSSGDPFTLDEMFTNVNDTTIDDGDTVWIKADGTYTLTANKTFNSNSGTTSSPIIIEGYTTTIGDNGRATIACGSYYINTTTGDYYHYKNIEASGSGATVFGLGGYSYAINCKFTNSSGSFAYDATRANDHGNWYIGCEASCVGGEGIDGSTKLTYVYGCYVHDSVDGVYFDYSSCAVMYTIFDSCTDGLDQNGGSVVRLKAIGNTFYNCNDGIEISMMSGGTFVNNIFASCTNGIRSTNPIENNYIDYNNWYDCTTTVTNITQGDNKQELDPEFTDAPNGDFSVTNTNLLTVGFPSDIGGAGLTTSNPAIGAYQENDQSEPESTDYIWIWTPE